MKRYLPLLVVGAAILAFASPDANAGNVAINLNPIAQQLADDPYSNATLVATMFPVRECQIVDHGDCATAQAGENCAPEGFPIGLCHCILSPNRLCIETP